MGYILKTSKGYYFDSAIIMFFTNYKEKAFIFKEKKDANEIISKLDKSNIEYELIKLDEMMNK